MSFMPPENSPLHVEPGGRMRCTTLLQMQHAGFTAEEELAHLGAHARTCEPPAGVDTPSCACPWCEALRHEYGRRIFEDPHVRRFQLFGGEFGVGEAGEPDYVILQRLLDHTGTDWDDGALLETPWAKGYFVTTNRDGALARLVTSTDDPTASVARRAFEDWSDGQVEWLPAD